MVGFRHLDIDESFRLSASAPTIASTEATLSTTTNNLYGMQFGGDLTMAWGEMFYFTFFGKGGTYYNDMGHRIRNVQSLGGAGPGATA